MTAVMLRHWSAQKKAAKMLIGLNTIYENISKYHLFLIQGKLIDLKYAGQQLIYVVNSFFRGI